jgi:outer membrane protein OmpA-like peptidoglycan-associated protein
LLKQGLDKEKISMFSQAEGGFIAENRTPEGRRKKRRVEIEFVFDSQIIAQAGGRRKIF